MFSRKTKVYIDTNIFLLPFQGIDIFTLLNQTLTEPYELYTLDTVFSELEKLSVGASKDARAAKLGFIMAKQKALKTTRSSPKVHVDDALVAITGSKDIVVTQDRELIKQLLAGGVRVLRYQQKKFVFQ